MSEGVLAKMEEKWEGVVQHTVLLGLRRTVLLALGIHLAICSQIVDLLSSTALAEALSTVYFF
jgi:hypothetical protein